MEGGLSNFTDDLNDKLMKLGFDLTKFALEYAEDVIFNLKERKMTREELKEQIDELMRQYDEGEIDGATYAQQMMELTSSARNKIEED